MNIFKRIKNLIALSEFEPGQPSREVSVPGTEVASLVKEPEKKEATFIPFVKKDPIKQFIEESNPQT